MTRTVVQLEPLWTIEDVAVYLRVPVQTLYQWRRKGIGPPAKKCGRHLVSTENDKRRGTYIDPNAGALTFRAYAEAWLESQTFEESTREAVAVRLRKHILPHLGCYTLAVLSPTHIRTWNRAMQKLGLAPSYRQVMFIHVQTIDRKSVV